MKKTLAALLAVLMVAIPLAACNPASTSQFDTLVIAVEANFEEQFNPFYADNAYDMQVMDQIFVTPQRLNADNELQDWAGSITSEEKEVDGETHIIYTVTIKDDMVFSDGEPITIDDLLYSYYVYADPGYSGPSSTWATTTSIVGLKEYYYDDADYTEKIAGFEKEAEEKYSIENISKEDYITYLIDTELEGWWNGDPESDYGDGETTWSEYIISEGFEDELNEIDATDPEAMLALLAEIEYTNYAAYYDPQSYWLKKLQEGYITGNLEDGVDVAEISGIKRVDDYTCTVEFYEIDIYGDRSVNVALVPEHYYGEFDKGKSDDHLLKNLDAPMGSGPYKFIKYEDNIVTAEANDKYFEGKPKIKNVKWQYIAESALISALKNGEVDIIVPSANQDKIDELNEAGMKYSLVDNNGYGYLGLNANNLDKNVRKGLLHLMDRQPSVEGYYGTELAEVIERPMTTTLAEYPDDAEEYYGYDTTKALEYFKAAGYEQVDGKLVKDGKQLTVDVYIGGSGEGDHPGYNMLVQAQNDLDSLGGELIINDVQFSVLQDAMDNGTADMFVLAWGASNTCDKTTIYKTGAGQNRTNISNERLDELLDEIIRTVDLEERKTLVAESLDIVMDEAVELPLYQRKNMIAYNPEHIKESTWPETSTYWTYEDVLWTLELN